MTKIRLQSICIQNFKKTRFLLLNLVGKNTNISGANGSGKTTVYKAYYWCLTGKTMEPNEVIQTLDENNEVVHKIETSVVVTLLVDDSYEVRLERKLTEDWKALGQPDEQLKGTKQSRFFNDIPLSMTEFNAKLNTICDFEKLLMLSDITKFMGLKMDERRKLLMSVAGEVDEAKLMAPYPALLKAVAEKKTVDELRIQTLSTKKRANEELKTIPSQIVAQDKLKSSADFDALRKEKKELDMKISDCDRQLQASPEELQSVKEHSAKLAAIESKISERKNEWWAEHTKETERLRREIMTASDAYSKAMDNHSKNSKAQSDRLQKKMELVNQFEEIREKWNKTNEEDFDKMFSEQNVCPTCGHQFTEDEKHQARAKAIANFNADKSKRLTKLQKEAEQLNERITFLTGSINEYIKVIGPSDENALRAKESALNDLRELQKSNDTKRIEFDSKIIALQHELEEVRAQQPQTEKKDVDVITVQKRELTARRDAVIELLSGEQTNARIDREKQKLNERSAELAQIVADCDKALYQIQEYRKAKVDAVEGKVNSFFSLARWKFFEKNVSNDDLQEVCICHHNGVDYNSTNGADKINLGVDIIACLGKAFGIEAPLFIDSAESVADLIKTDNQIIKLTHVPYAEFATNSF